MSIRPTGKPLPTPQEIRDAIEALASIGVSPLLHGDGVSFVLPVAARPTSKRLGDTVEEATTRGPGRVLQHVIADFGIPAQVDYYNHLGFDVRWDGVNDDGEWILTLVDRRPGPFRTIDGQQIAIDAHYTGADDG